MAHAPATQVRVLVVIPALNEERSLPPLLAEFRELRANSTYSLEVVVIDDGSIDGTSSVAGTAGVRVVRLCRNIGIGAAVQTGLRLAHAEGFHAAIQVDGDGQHPPGEIDKLVRRSLEADCPGIVIGSRLLRREGYQPTRLRRLGQIWLTAWLRLACGVHITDPTSGFRVYGREALALFQRTYPSDFPEPEAVAIAIACGLPVVEEPVRMRPRQGGRSSIVGLKPAYYMVKVTIAVLLSYFRHRQSSALRKLEGMHHAG